MADVLEYKCPCCGGAIAFDSTAQKLKCPYCDTEFDIGTIQSYNDSVGQDQADDMQWDMSAGNEWQPGETEGMRVYVCRSCGGEIVAEETTAAMLCPFCGNPVVMTENVSGMLKPDYVIPFKLDKKAAKQEFMNYTQGKKLLPRLFHDETHIDKLQGVYVPFWLFDADVAADIRYRGTQVRHWSDSRYNYTETSYYALERSGNIAFDRVPVDGSQKMADDLMESIEPYDFSAAVPFQTAYMAGYVADKYDVTAEQSIDRANERIKNSTERTFAGTTSGYASVQTEHSNIRLFNGRTRYALYPVWLLNTTWNDGKYVFAMNGQTGKFVGDLPMDKSAYRKYFLTSFLIVAAIAMGVTYLVWRFLM